MAATGRHAGTRAPSRSGVAASFGLLEQFLDLALDHYVARRERLCVHRTCDPHEVSPGAQRTRRMTREDRGTKLTTGPIAVHGRAKPAADGECQTRGWDRVVGGVRTPERLRADPPSRGQQRELAAGSDAMDQAESRARPLARRDLRTARPARVLMRARKPCFFARR